jgi:hypothetical protein
MKSKASSSGRSGEVSFLMGATDLHHSCWSALLRLAVGWNKLRGDARALDALVTNTILPRIGPTCAAANNGIKRMHVTAKKSDVTPEFD